MWGNFNLKYKGTRTKIMAELLESLCFESFIKAKKEDFRVVVNIHCSNQELEHGDVLSLSKSLARRITKRYQVATGHWRRFSGMAYQFEGPPTERMLLTIYPNGAVEIILNDKSFSNVPEYVLTPDSVVQLV